MTTRNQVARLFSLLFIPLFSSLVLAGPIGLGGVLGDPTGITAKYWLDSHHAIDGAMAWSFSGANSIHLQSSYLIHKKKHFHIDQIPLNLYYGAGGRLSNYSSTKKSGLGMAGRVPVGVTYEFRDPSVELFAEVAPGIELIPSTSFFVSIGIGGRFYF